MKLTITPEQIFPYLAHNLKCKFNSDEIYTIEGMVRENVYCKELTYAADLFECRPFLRSLDSLTKPITDSNGERVTPILELAKIEFPHYVSYSLDGDEVNIDDTIWFSMHAGDFFAVEPYEDGSEIVVVLNQLQLFKWLFKNHFALDIDESLYIKIED